MSTGTSTAGAGPAAPSGAGVAPAVELRDITAGYGDTTVLRGISLTAPAGTVTALLGPNGAGKTTLLKTISGLIKPAAGSVLLAGDDVTALAPNQRVAKGLCHIPEGRGIFRRLTVRQNLLLQAEKGHEERAIELARDAFPVLGQRLGQQAGTLSGGEQQMLAMARAYVRDPQLILVDEASLGLAPLLVESIFVFLRRLVEERRVSLLIVDQFVNRALAMASKAYILRHGELVFEGSADELANHDMFSEYLGTGAH